MPPAAHRIGASARSFASKNCWSTSRKADIDRHHAELVDRPKTGRDQLAQQRLQPEAGDEPLDEIGAREAERCRRAIEQRVERLLSPAMLRPMRRRGADRALHHQDADDEDDDRREAERDGARDPGADDRQPADAARQRVQHEPDHQRLDDRHQHRSGEMQRR